MWHTIFHIYGPFAIHGYGLMIAIGLLVYLHLLQKDFRFHQLKLAPHIINIILVGIITSVVGGRILFFIMHPEYYENFWSFLAFFNGGLSILGSLLLLLVLPFYLRYLHIPVIPFLDLIALYAPLLQSFGRIGCFLAGCCYGLPTQLPWGITYTTADSEAPLYACLHPTQLYSAIGLLLIFALLYFFLQHIFKKNGQILCCYILLAGLERFILEFWRGDRVPHNALSLNHYIAGGMVVGATIGLILIAMTKKTASHS